MRKVIIPSIICILLLSFFVIISGCGGGSGTTTVPIQVVATDTPSSPDAPTQIPTTVPATPTPIVTFTPSSATIDLQQQIDAAGGGWTAGNNPVAALPDESKTLLCGCNLSVPLNKLEAYNLSGQQVPSSFNRNNYLTSIKDQGSAGTCVAFAAVACVESCVRIALNDSSKYIDLSEAHLFHYGGGNVNSGWYLSAAANYFQNPGVPPEEYFPYNPSTVASGTSKSGWENYVTKINSWQYLGNAAAIKDYIYNYGPVLSGFDVYSDFFYYKSGVYKHVTGYQVGGHAICIYGWDDNAACWLVKNSWGYSWGDSGTFRIAYGQCNIENWSIGMRYIPSIVAPTPTKTASPSSTPTKTPLPASTATPTKAPVPNGMVLIPGGAFSMGSNNSVDEKPIHSLTISSFYMGKYEVTNSEYVQFLNSQGNQTENDLWVYTTPTVYQGITGGPNPGTFSVISGFENRPMIYVSWYGAVAYCNWLSAQQGLTPCYGPINNRGDDPSVWRTKNGYRLPTEAEWEYACRAGTTTNYYWADDATNVDNYAWYSSNAATPKSVGEKLPNAWGLYDMSGNVYEWCSDYWNPDYYSTSPGTNPTGPSTGADRIIRGGCWYFNYGDCRSAKRSRYGPDLYGHQNIIGFRIVRNN